MRFASLVPICLVLFFASCREDEAVVPSGAHMNLTRNTMFENEWKFVLPQVDSITRHGKPYYAAFPEFIGDWSSFTLSSIDKNNRLYVRQTFHLLDNTAGDIQIFTDTVSIDANKGDSITWTIYRNVHTAQTPQVPTPFEFTFTGKFNPYTNRIEGRMRRTLIHKCIHCTGDVYYSYTGMVPALRLPSP
jgi:hypothetical protein